MDTHLKQRFGKLTVLDNDYSTDDYQRRLALVQCDCGTPPKPVLVANLKAGRTQSCGLCTEKGGVRKRPYKPRRGLHLAGKVSPVTTTSVSVNGRAASE